MNSPGFGVGWTGRHLSRRAFLAGAASFAAVGTGAAVAVKFAESSPTSDAGFAAISMAMHVHASASEGPGSMQAQLVQAANAGVEVLWWTEHDHRMAAHAAPIRIQFTGADETDEPAAPWTWSPATQGTGAKGRHQFCTPSTHALVAPYNHALQLSIATDGKHVASHQLSGQAENTLNRTSLAGATIRFAVRPIEVSANSYVAVNIVTSYRPRSGGQPAGVYVLSYRIGGAGLPGVSKVIDGTTGLVYLAASKSNWTVLNITPESDLTRLWPGVDGRDASLTDFTLVANARGKAKAEAYFADLQFDRADHTGQKPLEVQAKLIEGYAPQFATVRQIQALELSLTTPHLGWYGGTPTIPTYPATQGPLPSHDPAVALAAVKRIHESGGLASYCHPFGVSTTALSPDLQEKARAAKSSELIANQALGCDLLEVGYRLRGGCDLSQHESVWDNCSRNLIFLTGIGVNDDHVGRNWVGEKLNFITWAWAQNTSTPSLLAALRRGRVFFGDLARFHGSLDIRLNGRSAMGGVSPSGAGRRTVEVVANGLPEGASVQVLRGTVDLTGPSDTTPQITRITLAESEFDESGGASVDIDTSKPRFVRSVVVDRSGLSIAYSNPVWLVHKAGLRPTPSYRVVK